MACRVLDTSVFGFEGMDRKTFIIRNSLGEGVGWGTRTQQEQSSIAQW